MSNELTITNNQSLLSAENYSHYKTVAKELSRSQLVPKEFRGKPDDVLIAMETGHMLGLNPIQSLQGIAIINGKAALHGDSLLAVCQSHPAYEYLKETPLQQNNKVIGYQCIVKRAGHEEHCSVFTLDDAEKAGLLTRPGPWKQYPARMLQMRARGFALRDTFADALRGVKAIEEIRDYGQEKPKAQSALDDILKSKTSQETEKTNDDIVEAEYIEPINDMQLNSIHDLIAEINLSDERIKKAKVLYQVESFTDMTAEQAGHFMSQLIKEKEKGL